MCSKTLNETDPGRPTGMDYSGITGSFVNGTVPDHAIWKTLPYTFLEDHHNNWAANYPASRMHYDLCRYAGKHRSRPSSSGPIRDVFRWRPRKTSA